MGKHEGARNTSRLMLWSALIVSCLVFLSAGCGPSRPRAKDTNTVLDSETIVMLDTWAATQLARQKEWVETKNGFMEPHVILRNKGGRTLHLEIRAYFKDTNGGTIETPTDVWDPVTVNPHEDYHYWRLCPNKNGASYQFHVRLGKEVHE
jgi:uncharacterized protein YcfL